MIKNTKTFPMRFNIKYSAVIDRAVFYTKAGSKHEYILEAINEKIERDNKKYPQILGTSEGNEVV